MVLLVLAAKVYNQMMYFFNRKLMSKAEKEMVCLVRIMPNFKGHRKIIGRFYVGIRITVSYRELRYGNRYSWNKCTCVKQNSLNERESGRLNETKKAQWTNKGCDNMNGLQTP